MNGSPRLIDIDDFPGDRCRQLNGLQQCYDLRSSARVSKTHKRKRSISSHERRGIAEHLEQRFMETCPGRVLPKNPCVRVSDLFYMVGCETNEVGIPPSDRSIVMRHSLTHLDESMLDV